MKALNPLAPPPEFEDRQWGRLATALAAALISVGLVTPVWAAPEVWLIGRTNVDGTQIGRLSFDLTCPAGHNPGGGVGPGNATQPHYYRANSFFRVEAGNVAGNAGDQEMLPEDHPGRA
ncbi:MAG: hypothetical protein OXE94_08550 [Aestuariivita sp.]|nr:hypothetical protein [Aestuariivita sp.]MCY4203419.1 hypothetical protein [Aestuariivita sp.]